MDGQDGQPQKPDSTGECDAGVVSVLGPIAKVPDTKADKTTGNRNGCGGLKGNEYQINLLVATMLKAILLKALGELGDWKLTTEDKVLDKFDDIVFQSQGKYTLIQAKNKDNQSKLITYEKLLSLVAEGPLCLAHYYLSWQKLKKEHIKKNIERLIICANAGMKTDDTDLMSILNKEDISTEHLLYFKGLANVCYTFKKGALEVLKRQIKSQKGEAFALEDDDIRHFLSILQIFPNFLPDDCSPGGFRAFGREAISQIRLAENLEATSALDKITDKVKEMYKAKRKEIDPFRAEAYFCEIISSNFCKDLKGCNVKWENNELHSIFQQPDRKIFHVVVPQQSHLMLYVVRVFQALHNPLNKSQTYLFLNPNESIEAQKSTVQAFFKVPVYTSLAILSPLCANVELVDLLCSEITESKKYKKVIVIGKEDSALLHKINKEKGKNGGKPDLSICELSDPITFCTFSRCTQQNFMNRIVVFQGIPMSLEKVLASGAGQIEPSDTDRILDGEILARLTKTDENILIWQEIKHSEKNIENYYIPRHFIRDEQIYSEEQLCQNGEKLVLISDVAGMGKSTVLGSLSMKIKTNFSHLWVIRIDLNKYTEILSRCIRKRIPDVKLIELLESQLATQLKSEFERRLFEVKDKVVLMVDAVDEISPDYFDIISRLLEECRSGDNIKRIFVTTRPHMCKNLEERFSVKSYILEQYLEDNQVEFLTKYWIEHLHLREEIEKQERCARYSQQLIKEIFVVLQDNSERRTFAGIPLQTRMLAEVFQESNKETDNGLRNWEGCKEFLDSKKEIPSMPEKINLNQMYTMFIDKKRDIFINDKCDARGNPRLLRSMTEMFNKCHQCHQVLALQVALPPDICELFDIYQNKEELLLSTKEYLSDAGIIQQVDGKWQFIHRTFAEYYVAECLLLELKSETQNDKFKKFFLTDIVLSEEYYVIRAFLDDFIKAELHSLPRATLDIARYAVDKFGSINRIRSSFLALTPPRVVAGEGCLYLMKLLVGQLVEPVVIIDDTEWAWYVDNWCSAAENGHLNVIRFLFYFIFQQNPTIRSTWIKKRAKKIVDKAILFAAGEGHLNVVKFLVEQDMVGIDCSTGFNACHLAAQFGYLDVMKFLFGNFTHTDWVYRRKLVCEMRTMLHVAANNGHVDVVKFLLQVTGVNRIGIEDMYGNTPLHLAANSGNLQVVEAFIAQLKGTNWIRMKDDGGNTALHIATLQGNLEVVKFLVEQLGDVKWFDIKNIAGHTALHYAANEGKLEIVKYFIEQLTGTKWVDIKDNEGRTALHVAVGTGNNLPVIKFLLEQSEETNCIYVQDTGGHTAFHTAASVGSVQVVECFMEYLADTNWIHIKDNEGGTAFHSAANEGNMQVLHLFFKQLSNTHWTNIKENTYREVGHVSAIKARVEVIKFFIKQLRNIRWIDVENKKRLIDFYFAAYTGDQVKVNILAKQLAASIMNFKAYRGDTVLHFAAATGNLEVVKFLMEQLTVETNWVDIINNGGNTALHYAASRGKLEVVEFLTDQLADETSWTYIKNNEGHTALHFAASSAELHVVEFLMKHLANAETNWVDVRDNEGGTALHTAAFNGELEMVKFFIRQLTSATWIDIRDDKSLTALHAAAQRGQVQVVYFLLEQYESKLENLYSYWSLRSMKPFSIIVKDGAFETFDFGSTKLDQNKLLDMIDEIKVKIKHCNPWVLLEWQNAVRRREEPYAVPI